MRMMSPRKKRGARPSNGNLALSEVKGQSDAHNLLGNWIVFSKPSSHWKSEARPHDS